MVAVAGAQKWDGSKEDADRITSWCGANGGEARYVPEWRGWLTHGPRIAVRTRDGWAYCSPGQWIIDRRDGFNGYIFREFTVSADAPASVSGGAER